MKKTTVKKKDKDIEIRVAPFDLLAVGNFFWSCSFEFPRTNFV